MTPRIPGYHFRPLVEPKIHNPLQNHLEPKFNPPYIPENPYSYDKLLGFGKAWEEKIYNPYSDPDFVSIHNKGLDK